MAVQQIASEAKKINKEKKESRKLCNISLKFNTVKIKVLLKANYIESNVKITVKCSRLWGAHSFF